MFTFFALFQGCAPGIVGAIDEYEFDGIPSGSYRIFTTSTTYSGNLGGRSGADTICSTVATSAGLSLTYRAALKTSTDAASVFFPANGPLWAVSSSGVRVLIASDISVFFGTSSLTNSPRYSESGVILSGEAWTSSGALPDCQNWTSDDPMNLGDQGIAGIVTGSSAQAWILGGFRACEEFKSLYCIGRSP